MMTVTRLGDFKKRDPFVSPPHVNIPIKSTRYSYHRWGWLNENYPTTLRRKTKFIHHSKLAAGHGEALLLCELHHSQGHNFNQTKKTSVTRTHARVWVSGRLTPLTVWKSHCDAAARTHLFRWYTFITETIVEADDTWWMRAAEHHQKSLPLSADTDSEARWGMLRSFIWIKLGGNV